MKIYHALFVFSISLFSTYFVMFSELFSQNSDTWTYFLIYFIFYSFTNLLLVIVYEHINKNLISKSSLIFSSILIICVILCLFFFTIYKDNTNNLIINNDLKNTSFIEKHNMNQKNDLNLILFNINILFLTLILSFILNTFLDFYQNKKEKKKNYFKIFFLNLGFYISILLNGVVIYFIIGIFRFFAGFG